MVGDTDKSLLEATEELHDGISCAVDDDDEEVGIGGEIDSCFLFLYG